MNHEVLQTRKSNKRSGALSTYLENWYMLRLFLNKYTHTHNDDINQYMYGNELNKSLKRA